MKISQILLAALTLMLAQLHVSAAELPLVDNTASRVTAVRVDVAPDHADWTYSVGDPVTFTITVVADGKPVPGVEVEYSVGPEKHLGEAQLAVLENGTLNIEGGTLETPGFLRCVVNARIGDRKYRGLATAAFEPFAIQPTQMEPEDFDEYWQKQLDLVAGMPLNLKKTLVPEQCTADVNVYHVSYQTYGKSGTSPFYGMLAEPKQPGSYPAILQVPGAGVRPYSGNTGLAAHGAIVLSVGIHGIPVNLPQELYDSLRSAALNGYPFFSIGDRDKYYYHRVYLGCYRGNDVLTSHPMWDGKTLVVNGGSQGGMLSIVTAALDKRVTGLVSNYPAYCDVTGYIHGRAGGWPHLFRWEHMLLPEYLETASYYDVVNFARRLRIPGSFAWGYNDETCPPTSMFAAYNVITAPKELNLQLDMGHGPSEEFSELYTQRILKMAGLQD